MLTNLRKSEPAKSPPRLSSGLFKWLGRYASRQIKCLLLVAVFLLIFFVLNHYNLSPKNEGQSAQKSDQILSALVEETADLNQPPLGEPFNLLAAALPMVQADNGFTPNYELENQDAAFIEENGLLALNVSLNNYFAGMKKEPVTYVVQSGDSPFSIAVKFGVNTDTILWANNLSEGDVIKPDQQLMILPINGVRVKVGAKDTVAALAKKYKGEEEEVWAFNNIYDDSQLVAGNFIIIPDGEMPAPPKPKVTAPKYANATPSAGNWLIAPTTGYDWGRLHGQNGVDIASACGTPIYAAAAGTIILADSVGWNFGYGKYIMIRHPNGVITVYGHTSQILVEVGQEVGQGQLIALMGTTGRSTGCHLHFEVRGAKNPMARR